MTRAGGNGSRANGPPPSTGWPIAAAAARVGVSVPTLRTWERRYGLAPTGRTEGGHRRYTGHDIAVLQRLQLLVRNGMPTGEAAAGLLDATVTAEGTPQPDGQDAQISRLGAAAANLDSRSAGRIARSVLRERGAVAAWTDVFTPALQLAGDRWERIREGVEREHLLTGEIHTALTRHMHDRRLPSPPTVLLAATPGEAHTLPLRAVAAALAELGVASCALGSLPPLDLYAAADTLRPMVALLWARSADTVDQDELGELGHRVPMTCAAGSGWANSGTRATTVTRDLPTTVALIGSWLRQPANGPGRAS